MSEVIGKIIHIGQTETVGSAGTFKKRLVVVKTNEQYSQEIPCDFVQDKTSILDQYKIGDEVKIDINIRGNSYNGKWYVSLNGWRISKTETPNPSAVEDYQEAHRAKIMPLDEPESDLPF